MNQNRDTLIHWMKGVAIVFIITSLIPLLIGFFLRQPIHKYLALEVSEPTRLHLREFGFDIFEEKPKEIPQNIKSNLPEKDIKQLNWLDRFNALFDQRVPKFILNCFSLGGVFAFVCGLISFPYRKLIKSDKSA